MEIKILGTGCAKCKSLEKVTREVVDEMNLDATVDTPGAGAPGPVLSLGEAYRP